MKTKWKAIILSIAAGGLLGVTGPMLAADAVNAPIQLTDAQMDQVVAGETVCTGSGPSATCTVTDTNESQFQQSVINLSETSTQQYAGASCSSGSVTTGNCNPTGDPVISGFYYNTNTGNQIGKPYP